MLTGILSLLMLLQVAPTDVFKKEMAPLQSAVDAVVTPVVARVLQSSKASQLEGYGVVVTVEVTLEIPRTPFSSSAAAGEIQASVARRRKDLTDKMRAFVKERVTTMASVASAESLTVIVHVANFNLADLPNLPKQILFTAKKEAPDEVSIREF